MKTDDMLCLLTKKHKSMEMAIGQKKGYITNFSNSGHHIHWIPLNCRSDQPKPERTHPQQEMCYCRRTRTLAKSIPTPIYKGWSWMIIPRMTRQFISLEMTCNSYQPSNASVIVKVFGKKLPCG